MKRRVMRMYQNDEYMTIHDALVAILKKYPDINPPNPFPEDFTIFNSIDGKTTYGLTVNNLWSIFNQWFARLAIAKKVPPSTYEYIWRGTVYTTTDTADKAVYLWRCLDDMVGWYCKANYNRWKHLILADIAQYDPLTNYNMEEYAGNTSLAARMRSSVGTIETETKVAPFDSSNNDLHKTTQKQDTLNNDGTFKSDSSVSGYDDATKTLTWDDLETPQGNATSVSKLTRKGNIGVTTSQQMIASEYELRKFNVLQEFMNEVAKYSLICDWDSMLNNAY